MTELPKTFDFAAIEQRWSQHWEATNAYRPHRPDAEAYTIVNPPPNVTGSLHIGHALDNTLQDILIRHARLQGKDALWVVGTDHAGIATQMVVERQLEAKQDKRTNYTRDAFVEKVWEWKRESGGQITQQLRRLGCSMDWSREQFTMDPHFSRAVTKVFVDLYNKGLIYRAKRLVNWDPKLKTAISDLEVETVEVRGHMWHFKYPLAGGETYTYVERDADGQIVLEEVRDYISIATTRPETMLGDGAVAVHPDDERYRPIVGKLCEIPVGPKAQRRLIPIITDEYPDPDFGSGAVKITGAHDLNDYGVAQRNGIPMYRLMDEHARMRDDGADYATAAARAREIAAGEAATANEIDALNLVPYAYRGLDRYDARKQVVADIDADGLMIRVEDKAIMQPFGDRSNVVIEPMLTDQWYVDAETLAAAPLQAVRDGDINIVPKSWEKTFFHWMENIQPWCVSRQLWWGHRIPAWYGAKVRPDGPNDVGKTDIELSLEEVVFVAKDEAELLQKAHDYYGNKCDELFIHDTMEDYLNWDSVVAGGATGPSLHLDKIHLYRDNDVLDTWFSSALWPFATLGWPDETPSPLAGEGETRAKRGGERGHAASAAQEIQDTVTASAGGQAPTDPSPARALREASSPARGEGGASLLAKHYPNTTLVSGFDILFFWDARMAMMGMELMDEVPWKTLYLHGLVRAADGAKMSKSKGNTVDPLILMDKYGADAVRFFMAAMESQGRDIKMDERRVEGYRNFATKLWNAARFCQANGIGASQTVAAPSATLAVNRWIIGEVVETLAKLDKAFTEYRFDGMADAIYHFVWGTFCDWYLELVKPVLSPLPSKGGDQGVGASVGEPQDSPTPNPSLGREGLEAADETRAVAGWVLDQILVMLHPFMPFITEELWDSMGDRGGHMLIHAAWPKPEAVVDAEAKAEIDWVISLISEIRSVRTELNIPPSAKIDLIGWADLQPVVQSRLKRAEAVLERLGRIREVRQTNTGLTGGAAQFVIDGSTFVLPLNGIIDLAAEKARLVKSIEALSKEAASLSARLNNPAFVEKAKHEAVEKARADHAEKAAEVERLTAALARLG